MRRAEATAWVVAVCAGSIRLSQARTLGVLVAGALSLERVSLKRVSLVNIGRRLLGTAKHQIKRCWRFCANDRIETADAMRGVVKKVLRKRKAGPARISTLYGRRMTIEELFRDAKNKRNGGSLRDTKVTRPERLDRLLLILAIAYLLLCGIGLLALRTSHPRGWSASSRNDCSVFTIGRLMLGRIRVSPPKAVDAVIQATGDAVPKWG